MLMDIKKLPFIDLMAIVILLITISIFGCSRVVKVEVPVPIPCPQPPMLQDNILPSVVFSLPTDTNIFVCVDQQNSKNLLSDVIILKEELNSCKKALDAYRVVPK